jgi:sporulation protein YlmC with PRC-barrel domain
MSVAVTVVRAGRRDARTVGHGPDAARQTPPTTIKRPPAVLAYMNRDSVPQEITSLVGREVYTNTGVFVGQVEDLRLDLDAETVTGLALHDLNTELFGHEVSTSRGVIVPYRWVQSVADVIIVNDIVERLQRHEDEEDEEVTA